MGASPPASAMALQQVWDKGRILFQETVLQKATLDKSGGFQTGGVSEFFGKVRIVSRTLSGLFLIGAKKTNQIGKILQKSGKSQRRTKKEGQVQIRKTPRLKSPPV